MTLNTGDIMFVGWDSDNNDVSFVTTVDIPAGETIYFTDDEWNGSNFFGNEQLIEWIVPAGGVSAGTVVTIDMTTSPGAASFDVGGSVDYIRGDGSLAGNNEMFWAFQGTRSGDDVTPTNFIGVIANEDAGSNAQTPNLTNTGLTTSNGAIIFGNDEDYLEFTGDGALPDPVTRDALIAAISDQTNWTTGNGAGNNNPNGTGFDLDIPSVICFTPGTRILTPYGERLIQDLQVGDLVLTLDEGAQPIRWIGRRRVAKLDLVAQPGLLPVVIRKNTFGNGMPNRDLRVSPQHRLLIQSPLAELYFGEREVLVPAIGLLNDNSIRRESNCEEVEYIHILFDTHQLIWADGAVSESYLPGAHSVDAMDSQLRHELLEVFPELGAVGCLHSQPARSLLRAKEATVFSQV